MNAECQTENLVKINSENFIRLVTVIEGEINKREVDIDKFSKEKTSAEEKVHKMEQEIEQKS